MFRELVTAFAIVLVCLVIHVVSIVMLAEFLVRRRKIVGRELRLTGYMMLLIVVFSVIVILHVGETGIWAAFFYERNLFSGFEPSLYFSITSYTTIGYGDVVLPQKWRLLGGIEGVSGVLLCGLSTAFIFAIVNALFQMRIAQKSKP
jgi:voltage-gated potassium channel